MQVFELQIHWVLLLEHLSEGEVKSLVGNASQKKTPTRDALLSQRIGDPFTLIEQMDSKEEIVEEGSLEQDLREAHQREHHPNRPPAPRPLLFLMEAQGWFTEAMTVSLRHSQNLRAPSHVLCLSPGRGTQRLEDVV